MCVFFFFSAKEEEKQKLLKWSSDLKQEREQLEQKVKQLSSSISVSEPPAFGEKADRASRAHSQLLWLPGPVNTADLGRWKACLRLELALRYRGPVSIWCLSDALEHPLGFGLRARIFSLLAAEVD